MQISYFCLNVHPLILAFLLDFACSKLLLGYPDGDFLFLSFLLHSLVGIFLEGRLPLPFFIYLIIYLHQMDSWIFISLSELESNPIIISFVVQVVWTLVTGSFLGSAPGTFQNTSMILFVCLTTCLLSGKGVLRVIFCFPVWDLESTSDYFLMNRRYL